MPTYDYKCFDCGHEFETVQRMSDPAITLCPSCGKEAVKRLISATAFHLKGSGWYKTDYASASTKAANGSSASADKAPSSSTETKPAETKPAEAKSAEAKPEPKVEAAKSPAAAPASSGSGSAD